MTSAPACRVAARAKINLGLRVLAREQSGYHQIETLFCLLELADEITLSVAGGDIVLDVSAPPDAPGTIPDLGPAAANLATRAARAFLMQHHASGGVHIELVKRIPAGAGLGGGSSDAAAVLQALNRLHGEPLGADRILAIGATLGSDVPFFCSGAALALAWGRGERILPLPSLPSAPVVLVIPPERIATAEAYAQLGTSPPNAAGAPAIMQLPRSWSDAAAMSANDFEAATFDTHPRLGAVREMLVHAGAVIARLTGSGSVVFGVFSEAGAAARAAEMIEREHADVAALITRTVETV